MAYTKVTEFSIENNNEYLKFLNKKLSIGIDLKNPSECKPFIEAITTPTFAQMYKDSNLVRINGNPKINDYNVNEFRGDAIVGYIVVTQLIKDASVGKMDGEKQKLVSNKRLSIIYDDLQLEQFVYTQSGEDIQEKTKADIIEALVYAIHTKSLLLTSVFLQKYLNQKDIINDLNSKTK